ncbi:hypothetical protein CTI14_68605, partial [Methylobacterium radiotolerans]
MRLLKELGADYAQGYVPGTPGSGARRPLGPDLGIRVVAEGVETESELRLLKELGADYAQGYVPGTPGSGARRPLGP